MRRCWRGRCRRARFSRCWPSTGIGSCVMRISRSAIRRGGVVRRSRRRSWPRCCCCSTARGCRMRPAMEAVAWDLRWKVALGLPVDHQGWHPTSLTKFRARLLLHRKEGVALENTLRLAEELGLLDGAAEQIIDSTPMLGAAATQDTVRLVRHGVRQADRRGRRAPTRTRPGGWIEGWSSTTGGPTTSRIAAGARRPSGSGCSHGWPRTPSGRCGRSSKPMGCSATSAIADAHRLLRELIGQDFDIDSDGVPRLHRGTRGDRIISTVDPEMRHGRKSQHQRFDGYKLSAAVTNTSKPLITAVEVAPASEQDGPQAKHLIDAQPQQRRPARVLGDTAYGTGPVRAELAEREVDVLAPVPEAPAKEGRLAKRDFHIDLDAGTVTCPAGQVAPIRTEPSGRRRASFRQGQAATAARCASRCVAPARGTRQIPDRTRRAAPDRRPPSPRRPRHRRAPAPHPPADRATARPARRTATEPARAATSAAPKPDCRPPGPPPWSTSTPSPATSPPTPPDQPQRQNHKPTPPDRPQQHPHATSLLQEPSS